MGFVSDLKNFFASRDKKTKYARMLSGETAVFSSWGRDIFAYDIIRNAVLINCEQMSKLTPKHIKQGKDRSSLETIYDNITNLLDNAPNPYMTASDFLSRCNYLYETTNNCFIYPAFNRQYIDKDRYRRQYTAFFPLDPQLVEFLEDESSGELFVRFTFSGGDSIKLPYRDVIHWKKDVTDYDIKGGFVSSADGSLEKLLQADSTAVQGIDKGVRQKLNITGILKFNSWQDSETQQKLVEEFEDKLFKSKSGILPTDIKADYVPLNLDPEIIDSETMTFVERRILASVGVPLEIYNRKFTEEEYMGYYETTLESRIKSFGEAFTKTLFTPREIAAGHKVIAYQQGLIYSSLQNKIRVIDSIGPYGVLSINEIRQLLGYTPTKDGDVKRVSLNNIDSAYATIYQLGKLKEIGRTVSDGSGTDIDEIIKILTDSGVPDDVIHKIKSIGE